MRAVPLSYRCRRPWLARIRRLQYWRPSRARAGGRSPCRSETSRPRPDARARRRGSERDRRRAADRAFRTIGSFATSSGIMRNGVLAVTRDGRIAVMNDVALPDSRPDARPTDIGRPFTEVLRGPPRRRPHDRGRVRAVAPAQPRRAAAEGTGKVIGYTLSQVRDDAGEIDRRDAVLQGPDPGRAARGARAAARSAGGARRDGRGDRARSEEPAGRHRSDGRAAEAPAARLRGRAVDPRATSSRKRRWPTPSSSRCSTSCGRSGCRSSASRCPMSCATRSPWPRATCSAASVRLDVDAAEDLPPIQGDPHQLRQLFTNLLTNAFEAMDGKGQVRIVGAAARRRKKSRRPMGDARRCR